MSILSYLLFCICVGYAMWLDVYSGRWVDARAYFFLGVISMCGYIIDLLFLSIRL